LEIKTGEPAHRPGKNLSGEFIIKNSCNEDRNMNSPERFFPGLCARKAKLLSKPMNVSFLLKTIYTLTHISLEKDFLVEP